MIKYNNYGFTAERGSAATSLATERRKVLRPNPLRRASSFERRRFRCILAAGSAAINVEECVATDEALVRVAARVLVATQRAVDAGGHDEHRQADWRDAERSRRREGAS